MAPNEARNALLEDIEESHRFKVLLGTAREYRITTATPIRMCEDDERENMRKEHGHLLGSSQAEVARDDVHHLNQNMGSNRMWRG
jgi:hypothetical protein